MRVPLAPVMAFWLSIPHRSAHPSHYGKCAWVDLAIAKAIGAVALGLFGGFTIKFAVDVGLLLNH